MYLLIIHGNFSLPIKKAAMRLSGLAQRALKLGYIVGCLVKKQRKTIRQPMIPVMIKNGMAMAFNKRLLLYFCRSRISANVQTAKTKNGEMYHGLFGVWSVAW